MTRRDHALDLARRGFRVFPLATAVNGVCSCGKGAACKNAGKHPLITGWVKDATTDEAQIRRWWHHWGTANIGLATGSESGVVVLDVDPEHGGEASLLALPPLPETVESLTGGGGRHLLFRHPGVEIRNKQSWAEYPGLDVRGDGGYIVAPGSVHRSGREYEWEVMSHPDDVELAELPDWLREMLVGKAVPQRKEAAGGPRSLVAAGPVLEGCAWLRHCVADAATLGEGPWKALANLCTRLEGGEELFHQWSRPYPGYSAAEAGEKYATAAATAPGPPTCQHIAGMDGAPYCSTCIHRGRISSPVVLAMGKLADLQPVPATARMQLDVLSDELPVDPDPLPQEVRRPFVAAGQEPASQIPAAPTSNGRNGHASDAGGRPVESSSAESNGHRPGGEMTLEQAMVIAKGAVSRVRDDAGAVFEAEARYALALLMRFDPVTWARLKQQMLRARIPVVKELVPLFPAVTLAAGDRATRAQEVAAEDLPLEPGEIHYAGDMLEDCPNPMLVVPPSYQLTRSATIRVSTDGEGVAQRIPVAFAPIVISGLMRNAVTGTESLLTGWKWPGQGWRQQVVDRGVALSSRGLVSLASIGFPISDDNAKQVVGYLHRLEAYNRQRLPCAAVSAHLGWQGEGGDRGFLVGRTLIHPDGEIETAAVLDTERPETWSERRIAFHGLSEGDEQIVDAYHRKGTWEGWLETARLLAPYPKALVPFYASFVPPLLELLSCPNFVVDMWTRTSMGKTTCLRAAGSVWGNPNENNPDSVVHKWSASQVFVERASAVISGLPLILDDTKDAKDKSLVAQVIYLVASGRGRGRGTITGLARTPHFRTVLLSTGEQAATEYSQDGGARTRTIELEGLPFGEKTPESTALVARLYAGFTQHYGHAGIRYLQGLAKLRAEFGPYAERYKARTAEYAERHTSAEAGRLAAYAAAVSLAGYLAHQLLELPWDYDDPMRFAWDKVAAESADAAGEVRAMRDVISWTASRETSFVSLTPTNGWRTTPANTPCSGRWDVLRENWEFIAFFPHVLKEVLKSFGYDAAPVISGWKQRGWLRADKEGNPTSNVKPGPGKPATRMFVIPRSAVEEINPTDPSDVLGGAPDALPLGSEYTE